MNLRALLAMEESYEFLRERAQRRFKVVLADLRGQDLEGKAGSLHIYDVYAEPFSGDPMMRVTAAAWNKGSVTAGFTLLRGGAVTAWCELPPLSDIGPIARASTICLHISRAIAGDSLPWLTSEVRKTLEGLDEA